MLGRYGVAVAAVAVAALVRWLLGGLLGNYAPYVTFLLAVFFVAWHGGLGPSLLALGLGAAAALLWFGPPADAAGPGNAVGVVLYLVVGAAASFLSQALRLAHRRAEADAHEAVRNRETLRVTLVSIGDAVVTTDAGGTVTFLNPVAEALTGWPRADAVGRPLREVFDIRREDNGRPAENPVDRVLREGVVVGLANHTILVARDGTVRPIDDSAAPIRGDAKALEGVVLVFRDVTERRHVERMQAELRAQLERQVRERTAQLAESEDRFRTLVEGTRDYAIFHLDPRGHITSWNPGAERINGYRAEEIIGQHFSRFYPEEDIRAGKPPRELEVAAREGRYEEEGWRLRKDGSRFFASVLITALRDPAGNLRGFSKITRDVTARRDAEENARRLLQEQGARAAAEARAEEARRAEQAIRAGADRLRFLADASAALAGLVDYESTLQKVARLAVPAFADWCGVHTAEPDGTLRRVVIVHRDPEKVRLSHEPERRYPGRPDAPAGAYHVLRTGRSELAPQIPDALLAQSARDEEHLRLLRQLGLQSYISVPLTTRGRTLGVLSFASAESGRHYGPDDLSLAEDLAHRAAVVLENARLYTELRETDRRKDEFLAMLAHELRNPLAPIRNALHVLKVAGTDPALAERSRELMERQVHHLVRLVDDLLDVSRIMRGRIDLRKETVELAAVVSRAVETAQPEIDARRHELSVSMPEEPVYLDADPVRLAQVLANLLNNAAKYTEQAGEITLTAELASGGRKAPGEPPSNSPPTEVTIRVRDTGIGISPEMLPRIFDLFVQADRTLGRSQGGMGIGLTLVRRLVEMHGGRIRAHSEGLGKGSEFVVRLPLAAAPSPPAKAEGKPAAETAPTGPPPRRRVLVVDDNTDSADSLGTYLRLEGQDVRVVHDGPAALEAAREYRPDVVLLDIGMPGMDGNEVARRLRQMPELSGVYLVALTGWGQEEDRRRSAEAGFDRHLVKPVEPAALKELLEQLLP